MLKQLAMNGPWQFKEAGRESGGILPSADPGWPSTDWEALWHRYLQQPDQGLIGCYSFAMRREPSHSYRLTLVGFPRTWRVHFNGIEIVGGEGALVTDCDVTRSLRDENVLIIEMASLDGERADDPAIMPQPRLELVETGRYSLLSARFDALQITGDVAQVRATVVVHSPDDAPVVLEVGITGEGFTAPGCELRKLFFVVVGENDLIQRFDLAQVRPWSAPPKGTPSLYRACIRVLDGEGVLSDLYDTPFGLRTVNWANGSLMLNGEPASALWAAAPHFAWGERVTAYEDADSSGILVVQDIPADECPGDEDLSPSEARAREAVRLVGSHPSLAVWNVVGSARPASGGLIRRMLARRREKQRITLLAQALHDIDGTRPVFVAGHVPDLGR